MDMFSLTGQKTTVHTDSRSMQDEIRMAAGACAAITSMILQSYGPPQRIDRRMRKIRRYTDFAYSGRTRFLPERFTRLRRPQIAACHLRPIAAHSGQHLRPAAHAPQQWQEKDPSYLGIQRSKDCVFIQVTLNTGRTVDQKRAFYKAIADGLHERLSLRREDVFIGLVEVSKENWSFGNGEAQYAK